VSVPEKSQRAYPVVGAGAYKPPDYGRVVRYLSVPELMQEADGGRGDPAYRRAVCDELERRERESLE